MKNDFLSPDNSSDIPLLKKKMRERMHFVKEGITEKEMIRQSSAACSHLIKTTQWLNSGFVLLYCNINTELNVNHLIENGLKNGKTIALPRYDNDRSQYVPCVIRSKNDLSIGRYGIMEPASICKEIDMNHLDLAVIPGVAFDRLGGRLGRGGGYYDQILNNLRAILFGICFQEQIVQRVPKEAHDIDMNATITPDGKLDFN